jgi:signal transduction histidine kinase
MLDQEQRLEDEHALRTVNEYLERIVEERTNELRATNEQLHEANEAKSQFLRAMSHELRTPLNSVIGFSDILTRGITGDVSPEQRRQLEMINRSGRRLLAIVDDVLDLSRIEAHVVPVTTETFDAEALARELVDSVTPDATAKGLSLSVHGPEHDAILETDPDKVEQILLNLITNAVKYTDTGGVTIRIRRPGHSMIAFDVIDTGPGIPDELKEQVFEEFMQGDEHREGTGLGLAISRRLAELLGGTITLASQVGEGSTFTLLLPEGAPRHASSRSRG